MQLITFSTLIAGASAHGAMTHPRPRNAYSSPGTNPSRGGDLSCVGDACFWYHVGCSIGCPKCYNENVGKTSLYAEPHCTAAEGLIEPTNNDPEFRTWDPHGDSRCGDFTKYNPWRAPGKSPVNDPCGQASGFADTTSGAEVPMGYSAGALGSQVLPETAPTYWKAGSTAQVGWALSAQHGGGYSYRLCPKSQFGNDPQAIERCFQSNPLTFTNSSSTIHFDDSSHDDITVDNKIYTPEDGWQWKVNPIPGCACDNGLSCGSKNDALRGQGTCGYPEARPYTHAGSATPDCPTGTMFEPGFTQFTQGYLVGAQNTFTVMDEINVPNTPGEYILGWRWDCEETDQVWASCADIVITDGPLPPPSPTPTPPPAPTPTPSPTPSPSPTEQCDGFKPDYKTFACYYKGCAEYKKGSKDCNTCCEGCHIESDPNKGVFCMEDKVEV